MALRSQFIPPEGYELYRLKDEDAEAILAALIGDRNEPQSTLGGRRARESLPIIEDAIARFLFERFYNPGRVPALRPSESKKKLLQRLRSQQSVDRIYARASPAERYFLRCAQEAIKLTMPKGEPDDKQLLQEKICNRRRSPYFFSQASGRMEECLAVGGALRDSSRSGRGEDRLIEVLLEAFAISRDEEPTWYYSNHYQGGDHLYEKGNISEYLSSVRKALIKAMPPGLLREGLLCPSRIRHAKKARKKARAKAAP